MCHLFVYGSLMYLPIWERMITTPYQRLPARLKKHRRLAIKGADYPALIPASHYEVQGIVVLSLQRDDLRHLDRFEGEEYQRHVVNVELEGGRRLKAETYLYRPALASRLRRCDWDVDAFEKQGLKRMLAALP